MQSYLGAQYHGAGATAQQRDAIQKSMRCAWHAMGRHAYRQQDSAASKPTFPRRAHRRPDVAAGSHAAK
eukprot:4141308-Pyramimonas_sp.AAC.1